MTNKCKTDDSDGLEDAWLDNGEALLWVALQVRCHMRTFDEDGDDDD